MTIAPQLVNTSFCAPSGQHFPLAPATGKFIRPYKPCQTLRKLRDARKLTAPSLAALVAIDGLPPGVQLEDAILKGQVTWNVSQARICQIENGLFEPTPLMRDRLASALSRAYGRKFEVAEVFPEVEGSTDS
jgi:transcriptional regulator with XRE-family HTH domain